MDTIRGFLLVLLVIVAILAFCYSFAPREVEQMPYRIELTRPIGDYHP